MSKDSDEWFNMVDKYYTKTLPIVMAHAEAKMNEEVSWLQSDIEVAIANGTVKFHSDLKNPLCKLL